MISVSVRVDLRYLTRFLTALRTFASAAGQDPRLTKVFKQWAVRYRSFALERFDEYSKGGGDWPPLAPSTVARKTRRDPKTKRRRPVARVGGKFRRLPSGITAILVDTGTLKAALNPVFVSAPGQLEETLPLGVRVGFGGPAGHPKAKLTVGRLAEIHHSGDGVPKRPIIVDPPETVQTAMATDVERAVRGIIRDAGTGPI